MTRDPHVPSVSREGNLTDDFSSFVDENYPLLLGFLNRRVNSREDAKDLAQESLARLVRYSEQPKEVLKHILFRIATNALVDWIRREKAKGGCIGADPDVQLDNIPSDDALPDEKLQHHQELALARKSIMRLPDHCRQIYLLNRMDGMKYSEIAEMKGLSVKAVEKQMTKALTLMRVYMSAHGASRGGGG